MKRELDEISDKYVTSPGKCVRSSDGGVQDDDYSKAGSLESCQQLCDSKLKCNAFSNSSDFKNMKVSLTNPIVEGGTWYSNDSPSKAIDDSKWDGFSSKGNWWKAEFVNAEITRVDVTSAYTSAEAANVKVYIGTTLCGSLPGSTSRHTVYPVICDPPVTSNFVKIDKHSGTYIGFT